MTDRSEKVDDLVTIDGAFFKRQAVEAMRIYFAPFVGVWKAMAEATRPMSVQPSSKREAERSHR